MREKDLSELINDKAFFPATERQAKDFEFYLDNRERACNIIFESQLDEPDGQILRQVFESLIKRHEGLRTTFLLGNGILYQRIADEVDVNIEHYDLRQSLDTYGELSRLREEALAAGFDIEKGPLFRIMLARVAESQYFLGFVIDHIIADTYSLDLLRREFGQTYTDLRQKGATNIGKLDFQMKDYAIWERNFNSSEAGQRNLAYWERELSSLSYPFVDNEIGLTGRPAFVHKAAGGKYRLFWTNDRLKETASQYHSVPVFMMTAMFLWLSKLSGEKCILLGIPFSVRESDDLNAIMGHLISALYLKVDVSRSVTFVELYEEVVRKYSEALTHRHYSRRSIGVDVDSFCAAMFNNSIFLKRNKDFDIRYCGHFYTYQTPYYPIDFSLTAYRNGWLLNFHYQSKIFNMDMTKVFENFYHILSEAVIHKGILIDKLTEN